MSDSDGMKGTPYTFTISNVCEDDWASYQINLETIEDSTEETPKYLPEKYIKANLSVKNKSKVTVKLENKLQVTPTIDGAVRSYELLTGILNPKEEITYDLRIWMHGDVTAEDKDSMDATYKSKVSIIFSYAKEPNYLVDLVKNLAIEEADTVEGSGVIKVSHDDADIADNPEYTKLGLDNETVKANLKMTEYRYFGENPNNYVSFGERYSETLYYKEYYSQPYGKDLCEFDSGLDSHILRGCQENEEVDGYAFDKSRKDRYILELKLEGRRDYYIFPTSEICNQMLQMLKSEESIPEGLTITKECELGYSVTDDNHGQGYDSLEKCNQASKNAEASGETIAKGCYEIPLYNYLYYNENDYISNKEECEICKIAHNKDELITEFRIIGLVNTPEGQRVKLIKANPLYLDLSWDNKPSGTGSSIYSWGGSNDWSDSRLQELLNKGAYYNRTSGSCPTGRNNATTPCDFSETGLTDKAKKMIDKIIWNLGGNAGRSDNTKSKYNYERGITVYTNESLQTPRPTLWQGEVGLMYSSDYGYATGGGDTYSREQCLNKELYKWYEYESDYRTDCANTDWLLNKDYNQWTLSPGSSNGIYVDLLWEGLVDGHPADYVETVAPVIYLKPEVIIANDNLEASDIGSSSNPYLISLS